MQAKTAAGVASQLTKAENRVPAWILPSVKFSVLAVDACLAALSFVLAFKLREGEAVLATDAWAWSPEFSPYAGILYFAVVVRLLLFTQQRVYRFHGAFSYTREWSKVFRSVFVGSLLIVAFAFLFRGGYAYREFSYARSVFLLDFALAGLLFSVFHLSIRLAQTWFRNRDINLIPTLIVGTNAEAAQTIALLRERPNLGYRLIGVVSADAETHNQTHFTETPIVGGIGDLIDAIRDLEIQEVIITDDRISPELLFETMMQAGRRQRVEFRFAPSVLNLLPQKTSVEQIGVLPMVRLFREPLSDSQRFLKRASDLFISSVAAIITLPLWLVAAIAIKLDSAGPVFFKQERIGMDGRRFVCYKFRTMSADADENVHRDAYAKNIGGQPDANSGDDERPVFGKVKDDRRITRIGRILRQTSLDELPQILNVFRGEMSVVGPRPPIPYEVEEYDVWHRKRLDMKPGITGLWQVSGRNRLTFDEMVRVDIYYIENWSLLLDVKIIFLTVPAMVRGDGAR